MRAILTILTQAGALRASFASVELVKSILYIASTVMTRRTPAHPMSRHLIALSTMIRSRVSDGLLARGHTLTPSSTQVIPNLPLEGLGMSELASRLRLTLQRTGQLVQQLEDDGYVERIADASDGRAKRVIYSARGRRLVADSQALLDEVSAEFIAIVGRARFERLCDDLAMLDRELNGVDTPLRIIAGTTERR